MLLRLLAVVAVVATGTLAGACIAIDPEAQLCAVGADACTCTLGGGCDPGLACVDGTCTPVGPSSSGEVTGPNDDSSSDSDSNDESDTLESESSSTEPGGGGPNLAFVTSTWHSAALGGIAGADAICQARAGEAGLPGTYRAWLSALGDNARDRFAGARGWVRTDWRPFAKDLEQIQRGEFYHPPVVDEHGTEVELPDVIWTGTNTDGEHVAVDGTNVGSCDGWMSDDPERLAAYGNLGAAGGWWTAYDATPCSTTARLVCLGIDHDEELAFEPTEGRAVFVSSGLAANAGSAAADELCEADAKNAGYEGTFLALLATTDTVATEGFVLDGEPWVRADGVPVFREDGIFGPLLDTPVYFDALGKPATIAMAWSGAGTLEELGSETCSDWAELGGSAWMVSTLHVFWQSWSLGGDPGNECEFVYPVLCFEQ